MKQGHVNGGKATKAPAPTAPKPRPKAAKAPTMPPHLCA